jgi:hypothetical protein
VIVNPSIPIDEKFLKIKSGSYPVGYANTSANAIR